MSYPWKAQTVARASVQCVPARRKQRVIPTPLRKNQTIRTLTQPVREVHAEEEIIADEEAGEIPLTRDQLEDIARFARSKDIGKQSVMDLLA